jgi:cation diffusion facilitator family transporter
MNEQKHLLCLKISWISIGINLFLAVVKFIVGVLSNSISILTDAAHSLSDLGTTLVVIVSLRLSRKPADEQHPFGHGRAEDVGGLILSVTLFFVGIGFLKSSLVRLVLPQSVNINLIFIIIVFITAICKFIMGAVTQHIARKNASQILRTDAFHHYSDAVTSLAVGFGLFLVRANFVYLDSYLGIFISLLIVVWAFQSGKEFVDNLIGKKVSADFYQRIKDVAERFDVVEGVHGIEVHSYGDNKMISLHIELKPSLSLQEAHDVADSIEKKMVESKLGKCLVHVDLKHK